MMAEMVPNGVRHLELPRDQRTVSAALRLAGQVFDARPFVRYRDQVASYAEMDQRANRVAAALAGLGVSKGDRVAILSRNGLEYLELWFGLSRLGAIQLPLNTAYKAPQLLHSLRRAPVLLVVVHSDCAAEFAEVAGDLDQCRHVIWLGEPRALQAPGIESHRYEDLVRNARADDATGASVTASDTVAVMNTSGTTGPCKGVLLPHGQQIALGRVIAEAMELGPTDVYYNFFPLFHNTAQAMITLPVLLSGAQMVLTDKFSLSSFFPDVRQHRITAFYYIGEILHLLAATYADREPPAPSLRVGWGIGGAPADCAAFERHFGVRLGTGYGSTEANVPVIRPLGADPLSSSAGRVSGPFDVSIRDPDGTERVAGEIGEVCVRTREPDIVMRGYDADPDATAQALRDDWLWTGDAGRIDPDGSFYFEGRLKDVIRVRGENVSAFEVEQTVLQLAEVLEAAAVAVPATIGGDDVKLVVVPAPGATIRAAAIIAHCERLLPKFCVPRYIEVKDALPRTETNKIRKNVLREEGIRPGTWDMVAAANLAIG